MVPQIHNHVIFTVLFLQKEGRMTSSPSPPQPPPRAPPRASRPSSPLTPHTPAPTNPDRPPSPVASSKALLLLELKMARHKRQSFTHRDMLLALRIVDEIDNDVWIPKKEKMARKQVALAPLGIDPKRHAGKLSRWRRNERKLWTYVKEGMGGRKKQPAWRGPSPLIVHPTLMPHIGKCVPLSSGTSKRLAKMFSASWMKKQKKPGCVFNISTVVHRKKFAGKDNDPFHPFMKNDPDTAYTDRCRLPYNVEAKREGCEYGAIRYEIEETIQSDLGKEDHRLCRDVLLSTSPRKEDKKIYRQQLHLDFKQNLKANALGFVLIALTEGQFLYVQEAGCIKKVLLPVNTAFVGRGDFIHAGSEGEGKRLHFQLMPNAMEEEEEEVQTFFCPDPHFPKIK